VGHHLVLVETVQNRKKEIFETKTPMEMEQLKVLVIESCYDYGTGLNQPGNLNQGYYRKFSTTKNLSKRH
jgi:hypothetical protein